MRNGSWENSIYETIDDGRFGAIYVPTLYTQASGENALRGVRGRGYMGYLPFQRRDGSGIGQDNLTVEYHIYKVEKKIEVVYSLRKKAEADPEAVYVSFPYQIEAAESFWTCPAEISKPG